MMHFGN
nr:Chain A, Major prion protein [Mesocricetus auratus]3NVE_B Chain B, Major prion protein [Mesocricetus auratus]